MNIPSKIAAAFFLPAIILLGAASAAAAPEEKPKPPNLVIFLSDDHTAQDSSVYGSPEVGTPQMKRLAAAGMTFENCFAASPTCAPSRAALLTGLMPARNGSEANHSAPRKDIRKLPAYFQELGYEVVAFGKVAHYRQTADYGFDHFQHIGFHEDAAVPEALKWLEARQSDKPLCLFVGTNWPHVPWPREPEGHDPAALTIPANQVDTPLTRRARACYYAAISHMDRELGQTYDLARKKFGDHLFFLHFSDQGAQWPFAKWCLYDQGLRSPLIAVWPGKITPGTRTRAMVSLVDVLPTLLDVAGGKPPETLDGRSFTAVLRGGTDTHRDRIHATHSGDGDFNVYPSRCLRDSGWKYILNLHPEFQFGTHITMAGEEGSGYWKSWVEKASHDGAAAAKVGRYRSRPAEELYDLRNDPLEQHSLHAAPAHAARLATMRADLKQWMESQGDKATVFGKPTPLPATTPDNSAN
jgi:N-sulfoglucosamine sulfohydrolase